MSAPRETTGSPGGEERAGSARPSGGEAVAPLEWESWPLRDDYPRSLALCVIVLCSAVGIAAMTESVGWGLLSLVVLVLATLRYFVRTRIRLDETGAEIRSLGRSVRRDWERVRNVYYHRDGAFLSPFHRPSRLDSFRGVYLRYAGNRSEVEAFLRARVRPPLPSPAES